MNILVKNKVRILRPWEYEALLAAMPPDARIQLGGLLYTGMRYVEAQRFQSHPEWFDGKSFIMLPADAVRKELVVFKERTITLNAIGSKQVALFLKEAPKLPTTQGWGQNLKRWAEAADLDPSGLCAKTTRKTWESWLANTYTDKFLWITNSQGHTITTSLQHYLGIGFYPEDRKAMLKHVEGWIN